jgi:hypothetical protein
MREGDRVRLADQAAITMTKHTRVSHPVNWFTRCGTIVGETRKPGNTGVRWDGRTSIDYWDERFLVPADTPLEVTPIEPPKPKRRRRRCL